MPREPRAVIAASGLIDDSDHHDTSWGDNNLVDEIASQATCNVSSSNEGHLNGCCQSCAVEINLAWKLGMGAVSVKTLRSIGSIS